MKYGISFTDASGKVSWLYRGVGRPILTEDICEIALFVQEKSAISALKTLRKNGHEKDGRFKVVEVNFVVTREIDIDKPEEPKGFAIYVDSDGGRFYSGTKSRTEDAKRGHYVEHTKFEADKIHATVFTTKAHAEKRLMLLIDEAQKDLDHEKTRPAWRRSHWKTAEEMDLEHQQAIERAEFHLARVKEAVIRPFP